MSKMISAVNEFLSYAARHDFRVSVRGNVITVSQKFSANDNHGYANFEMIGTGMLYDIPATRDRNVWGSTGDGIGGMVAMQRGYGELHISGAQKSFLNQLKKILG